MKRLLVLGGGFAGGAVAKAGLVRGWKVAVATRNAGPRRNLPEDIERLTGDDAGDDIVRWAEGRDLIIDAAAPYALSLHAPGALKQMRIDTAKARMQGVLGAAAKSGVPLIHIGSFVTTAPPTGFQQRLIHASHPYFAIKNAMADLCMAAARAGEPVAVAAPSALFGPGDLRPDTQSFVGGVLAGALRAAPPDVVNVMDVRDMAEMALRMGESGWFGATIPLSGHDIGVSALAALIAEIGGVAAPINVPGLLAALPLGAAALYTAEIALQPLGVSTPPSLPALLTLAGSAQPLSPAQQALGVDLRGLRETIADEINWRRTLPN